MSLTPIDFYNILYDIADNMPAQFDGNGNEITCARLQTVAVVKDYGSEIQTTNLGKDPRYAGKKLFYSRQWLNAQESPNAITWGYPALFVGEGDEVYRNGKQPYEIDFSFALSDRVEQKQSETFNQSYCSQRTFEEVGQALRLTWQNILKTLNDYVYVRITIGANVSFAWLTEQAAAEQLANGDIDDYSIELQLTQYLGSSKARLSWDMHTEYAMTYFVQMPITFTACAEPAIPTIVFDDDALILFAAIEATGATLTQPEKVAYNTWFVDNKTQLLYTKYKAVYFMAGGTASAHKLNAINPVDSDAAFRLSFVGGWVHSSTGAKPNGINTYANSHFIPSVNAAANSISLGYYSGTDSMGAFIEMGVSGIASNSGLGQLFVAPNVSGVGFLAVNTTGNAGIAAITSTGMFVTSRNDGVTMRLHRNAALIATNSGLPVTASDKKIYVGARNFNNASFTPTNRECRAAFIAEGLSEAEANTASQLFINLQTALGRNI